MPPCIEQCIVSCVPLHLAIASTGLPVTGNWQMLKKLLVHSS